MLFTKHFFSNDNNQCYRYNNKYATCDARTLLKKIQKHSFYGATPVCLEMDEALSNKTLFQFGHVLDKKNLSKIFDRARTTFCSKEMIKSAAKELAILMQLQTLIIVSTQQAENNQVYKKGRWGF